MKKYLVTGGNGFIGANLVRALLKKNKKVLVLTEPNPDLWRLQDVLSDIGVIECDITKSTKVNQLIRAVKPSNIFHLAALGVKPRGDARHSLPWMKKLFDVNFFGTYNLLEACKKNGFDCFVTTGTASEYGCKDEPLHECLMLEPQDDYSISKAAATLYCQKEAKLHNLPVYIVRPFCAYGDFEPPHRLIPTILNGALQRKPIKLSSPNAVRDFVYVKDIVDSYLAIAEKRPKAQTIFNIGTGKQYSVQQIVDAVQSLHKQPLEIVWKASQPRPWEFKNWQADMQRTTSILGWQPKHSLENGLKKAAAWFAKNQPLYDNF